VPDVFGKAKKVHDWFSPEYFIADKAYDAEKVHLFLKGEHNCHPIIPLRNLTQDETAVLDKHGCPVYQEGTWKWKGSDYKRKRTKWFCPVRCGKHREFIGFDACCGPQGKMMYLNWKDDPRKHTLIPRRSRKFRKLYDKRTSVERAFSTLKNQYLLDTLRVQGIEKVRLHVNLSIFTRLLMALVDLEKEPPPD